MFYGFGEPQQHKTQFTYDVDHPLAFAAEDNGATPVEYVLVALGGCLTAGIASIAQQRDIQLRSVRATTEAEHDLHGILGADPDVRNGFSGVRVSYQIDATPRPTRSRRWWPSHRSIPRSSTSSPTQPTSLSTSPEARGRRYSRQPPSCWAAAIADSR
jgi:OsmC-like protein